MNNTYNDLASKLGLPENLNLVEMRLVGEDGNAFSILGRFADSAKKQGWDADSINKVLDEARAGDYNHLLRTIVAVSDDTYSIDYDDDDYDENDEYESGYYNDTPIDY